MGGKGSGRPRSTRNPYAAKYRQHGPAQESQWTIDEDRQGMWRDYASHRLHVRNEDSGFRLYINGQKRGFFDYPSDARSHAVWLVEHGNPTFSEGMTNGSNGDKDKARGR